MQESLSALLKNIKELEQTAAKNKGDVSSRSRLRAEFEKLKDLNEGALSYLDITTVEDIERVYGIDVEEDFNELEEKDIELGGASNPNNYAFMPTDIKFVIIGRTPKNEKLAKKMVGQIIATLKKSTKA